MNCDCFSEFDLVIKFTLDRFPAAKVIRKNEKWQSRTEPTIRRIIEARQIIVFESETETGTVTRWTMNPERCSHVCKYIFHLKIHLRYQSFYIVYIYLPGLH